MGALNFFWPLIDMCSPIVSRNTATSELTGLVLRKHDQTGFKLAGRSIMFLNNGPQMRRKIDLSRCPDTIKKLQFQPMNC